MKYNFFLGLLFFISHLTWSQKVTLFYNDQGELTIEEMASHYRIANLDTSKIVFVGRAIEYDMDSNMLRSLSYDSSGNLLEIEEKIIADSESLSKILDQKKIKFEQALYIRKKDYPYLKLLKILESEKKVIVDHLSGNYVMPDEYEIVEDQPEFPGGMDKLPNFLSFFLAYPEEAKKNNITGRVFVQFVIYEDGTLNEIKAINGIGYGCDEAAEYAISKLPDWKPGRQRGEPVRVKMVLPITFE